MSSVNFGDQRSKVKVSVTNQISDLLNVISVQTVQQDIIIIKISDHILCPIGHKVTFTVTSCFVKALEAVTRRRSPGTRRL